VTQATRTWNDTFFPVGDPRRGNFSPDCNLLLPAGNGECGAANPSNFGTEVNTGTGILRRIYGERHHDIVLSFPAVPEVTVKYTRLRQLSTDVADARVYGGIHFRFDQVAGRHLGKLISRAAYRAALRPVHGQGEPDGDDDDDDGARSGDD